MSRYFNGNDLEDSNHLEHWGILGMRWGVRHDRSSSGGLKGAIKRHKQKKILAKGRKTRADNIKKAKKLEEKKIEIAKHPSQLMKNKDLYTTQELNNIRERQIAEQNIDDISLRRLATGKAYAQAAIGYVNTAKDVYNILSSDTGQAVTRELNVALGTKLKVVPKSYDDFTKYYGGTTGISEKIAGNASAYSSKNQKQKKEE